MTMTGINGSRAVAAAVLPRTLGKAVEPARQDTSHGRAPERSSAAAATAVARTTSRANAASTASSIGFLAQTIAQESLLLGARTSKSDQRGPVALYRQTQDDAPVATGPQIGIDLKI